MTSHDIKGQTLRNCLGSTPWEWELRRLGEKNSWAKDVWANYFLGDRRLGDKLGRYGDSKSDGWATFFRRLGEMCERGESQN